jgi:hypothetical protein
MVWTRQWILNAFARPNTDFTADGHQDGQSHAHSPRRKRGEILSFTHSENIPNSIRTSNLSAVSGIRGTGFHRHVCYLPVEKPDVPAMFRRTKLIHFSRHWISERQKSRP